MDCTIDWLQIKAEGISPEGRSFATCVTFKNMVVIAGGRNVLRTFNDVWAFVISTKEDHPAELVGEWVQVDVEGAFEPRAYHTAVTNEQKMYIYGGKNLDEEYFGDMVMLDLKLVAQQVNAKLAAGGSTASVCGEPARHVTPKLVLVSQRGKALDCRGYHSARVALPETKHATMVVFGGHATRGFWCNYVSTFSFDTYTWRHYCRGSLADTTAPRRCTSCTCCASKHNGCTYCEGGYCRLPSMHSSNAHEVNKWIMSRQPVFNEYFQVGTLGRQHYPARDAPVTEVRVRFDSSSDSVEPLSLNVVSHGGELLKCFQGSLVEIAVPCPTSLASLGKQRDDTAFPIVEYPGYNERKEGPIGEKPPPSAEGESMVDDDDENSSLQNTWAPSSSAFHGEPPCKSSCHLVAPTNRAYHHSFMISQASSVSADTAASCGVRELDHLQRAKDIAEDPTGNFMLIWGGYQHRPSEFFDDAYLFDFLGQRWLSVSQSGDLPQKRASAGHAVFSSEAFRVLGSTNTILHNAANICVLFGGDNGPDNYMNTVHLGGVKLDVSLKHRLATMVATKMPSLVENAQ